MSQKNVQPAEKYEFNNDLIMKALPFAESAARYCFGRFPQLQIKGHTVSDLVNEWIVRKGKYLSNHDPKKSSFKYTVQNGIKWVALQYFVNDWKQQGAGVTVVSSDSFLGGEAGTRFIDTMSTDHRTFSSLDDDTLMNEMLVSLEGEVFGETSDYDTAITPIGELPKNLRSVAELLLSGWKKNEIAEMFGISKQYMTRLTRGRLAAALMTI